GQQHRHAEVHRHERGDHDAPVGDDECARRLREDGHRAGRRRERRGHVQGDLVADGGRRDPHLHGDLTAPDSTLSGGPPRAGLRRSQPGSFSRPILPAPGNVSHRFRSAPRTIPAALVFSEAGTSYIVIEPFGVTRPISWTSASVNQMFRSGPTARRRGPPRGGRPLLNSVTFPDVVIRPIRFAVGSCSVKHRFPSGPAIRSVISGCGDGVVSPETAPLVGTIAPIQLLAENQIRWSGPATIALTCAGGSFSFLRST